MWTAYWDGITWLSLHQPPLSGSLWSPGYLQFSCIKGFNLSSCYSNEPRCLTAHLCSQKKSNENTSWNAGTMFLKLFLPVFEVFSPPRLGFLLPLWGGPATTLTSSPPGWSPPVPPSPQDVPCHWTQALEPPCSWWHSLSPLNVWRLFL